MTDSELLQALHERVAAGLPAALVSVTGSSGSVPREPGAKMVVYPDGAIAGTIGGRRLAAQATSDALEALKAGRPRAASYELEPRELGMYCGGRVSVFIDVFAEKLKLLILGGGHVGEQTAALAAFLGIPHSVADDRPEFALPARFPRAREVRLGGPEEALKSPGADASTAVVIVTRCHGFDLRCLVAALGSPAFYIGMIGSAEKTERLFELCRRRGLEPSADPRVHAPIGLDLGETTPRGIALAILAEVLAVRNGASGRSLRRAEPSVLEAA
jgi:xanthine dehydrogenase accessory factor